MKIVDFTTAHIEQSAHIALQNYITERNSVSALPLIKDVPDLTSFAENGLGVAALDGDSLIGFLCVVPPFKNAFRSTDATGVFSPMGANGAIGNNRAEIYARMYQAAGEKWVRSGALSHALCLYAHDKEVQEQFFRYGFGMRSVDGIREMEEIAAPICEGYEFVEISHDELSQILSLDQMLNAHGEESPTFIRLTPNTLESFIKKAKEQNSIFFAAKHNKQIVAYTKVSCDGETFVCDAPGYLHVNGAFCLPEHRGKGLNQKLLSLLIPKLKAQGYTHLGVDFESINPTAWSFWPKHFAMYTHSLVRRIDEHILQN
jgi:GNAT superfamily N-acetyltransferase